MPLSFCQYLEIYDNKLAACGVGEGQVMKTYRKNRTKGADDNDGYYTKQPMGIHVLGQFTVKVAEFLGLPNSKAYTGHALRRTSATALAEAGQYSSYFTFNL